jgi:hypothetical protein
MRREFLFAAGALIGPPRVAGLIRSSLAAVVLLSIGCGGLLEPTPEDVLRPDVSDYVTIELRARLNLNGNFVLPPPPTEIDGRALISAQQALRIAEFFVGLFPPGSGGECRRTPTRKIDRLAERDGRRAIVPGDTSVGISA